MYDYKAAYIAFFNLAAKNVSINVIIITYR